MIKQTKQEGGEEEDVGEVEGEEGEGGHGAVGADPGPVVARLGLSRRKTRMLAALTLLKGNVWQF